MHRYFRDTYADARNLLLDRIAAAGDWTHEVVPHPLTGPAGEALSCDILWRGPTDAARVLTICSGVHGVEGFSGSALQSRFVDLAPPLAPDIAVMLVHGVNPYGFAHLRRVNEDNIDLNRNFIDFACRLPANTGYRALDAVLNPTDWTPDSATDVAHALGKLRETMSYLDFMKTVSGGQYEFPRGIQFGGTAPAWSRSVIERVWRDRLGDARIVVQIDVHTGLGPRGHGILMMAADDGEPHKAITADWFGPMLVTGRPASGEDTVLGGYMNAGLEQVLPGRTIPMTLEFGTEPPETVLTAMIEDNWLVHHGDPASDAGRAVKQRLLRAFSPDDPAWRDAVMARGEQVFAQALAGIATLDLEQGQFA